MKRALLIAACCLFFAGMQAQAAEEQKWATSPLAAVASLGELNLQAPTAVDNAGNVFATGQFTQPISIGSAFLEPIANSAYLAKYDAEGNALWAVALRGAATITSIATDEANNVYIAGTLADAVEVGSTDNSKVQTISGKPGEIAYHVSSFIAAYNADGVLQATKVIWSEANADVAASGLYFPLEGYPYATINHIEVSNGKLYASALYTGDVNFDDVQWQGMYLNIFDFMYDDISSYGIFSLNAADLTGGASVARIASAEQLQSVQWGPESLNFTAENGTVYLCFVGFGNVAYEAGGTTETMEFSNDADTGMREHAYVVSSISDAGVNTQIFHGTPHASIASYDLVGDMKVEGENLYIGGSFQQSLPFAGETTHTGACDLYAAALNKSTLEVQWTAVSGLDEGNGDALHFYENYTAMTVNNGEVSLYGYVLQDQDNNKTIATTLAYTFAGGTATSSETPLVIGAAQNGTTKALQTVNTTDLTTTLAAYTVSGGAGIQDVTTMPAQRVGNTFYFAEPADITVYDLQGRALLEENNAASVSIDGLAPGVYILSNGKSSLKALKANF